jgi:hypothetical protein
MIMSSALLGRPFAIPSAISRAQMSPALSSKVSTRPANNASGSLRARKPILQCLPLLSGRLLRYSALDFSDGQYRDEQVLVGLRLHPGSQRFRGFWLRGIADDVSVEKIAAHRSTSRPGVRARVTSRSAPTSGERRRAANIPPFFGGQTDEPGPIGLHRQALRELRWTPSPPSWRACGPQAVAPDVVPYRRIRQFQNNAVGSD